MEEITCTVCGRNYVYDRKKGHTTKKCNSCMVNPRRKDLKIKALEYKGGSCILCGYNKCNRALTFHHLDPSQKDYAISAWAHAITWEKLKTELDKCVLLCHNCHHEVHDGVTQLPTTIGLSSNG